MRQKKGLARVIMTAIWVLTVWLCGEVACYESPSSCSNSNSKYYNILTLTCTDCPANTEKAADMTYCNCTNNFYPNWAVIGFNHPDSCKPLPAGVKYP